jgi:hypothetical protein
MLATENKNMKLHTDPKRVRALAHRLWEQRGRKEGHALDDWLAAERQLRGEQAAGKDRPAQPEIPKIASSDAPGG